MASTKFIKTYLLLFFLLLALIIVFIILIPDNESKKIVKTVDEYEWNIPDSIRIPATAEGDLIRYGKSLIANTSYYLGPKGKVAHMSNGMNCQNCHLEGGTKFYGNNYGAVFSTYPKFRARSGTVEDIYKRVNDCFERSLNGKSLDTASREMQAIYAYIKWLGKNVPKKTKPIGVGIVDLPFLLRAANPVAGRAVFTETCVRCHQSNGQGQFNIDSTAYQYPPLWGTNSYTTGAGLFRLSRLAGYVKYNMPNGCRFDSSQLTEEQAWDVAAFVNSQPRPEKKYTADWPDINKKPFDHPYGPYTDTFTEQQHKYGPFGPIENKRKAGNKK